MGGPSGTPEGGGVGSERRGWEDEGQQGLCSLDSENGAAFDDAGQERDEFEAV